jgi:hypothetical protein
MLMDSLILESCARPVFVERFWSKVAKSDGCWLWTAGRKSTAYGSVFVGKKGIDACALAHRVAWAITHGALPAGLCVCHRCDVPPCVRPGHLFVESNAGNMADRKAKGRYVARRGTDNGHAKLTEDAVRTIRARAAAGEFQKDLAVEFGVHKSAISLIVCRKEWTHLL